MPVQRQTLTRLYAESLFHLQGLLQSVQYSLRSKQSDRSKPLAAWASEGLDSHHPEAQLPLQIFTVTCLTLPHPEFKEACDTSDICTHTAKHNISFSVLLAERISSFTYKKKKADFGGQDLHEPEKCPPAARQQQPCSLFVLRLCQRAGTALSLAQTAAGAPGAENPSCNFILHEAPNSSICAMEQAHQIGRQRQQQHWILHCFLSLISCGMMAALSLLTLFISIFRI